MSQRFESKCLEIPVLLLRHQTNSITTDRDEGGLNGHDMESKRSCVLMTLWRWLAPAFLFLLSVYLHRGTLGGEFIWDDRLAVLENRDVWTKSPWGDMWRHDFWGQQMADAGSHKSFRPLTTLTYRFNNVAHQWISQRSVDKDEERSSREIALGATARGPRGAFGFRAVNVALHAITSASSILLFRGIFAGEELPTFASSLLFTVHPVHVEAVAPIVGRADLLCGFLSVAALTLTVRSRSNGNRRRLGGKHKTSAQTTESRCPVHSVVHSTATAPSRDDNGEKAGNYASTGAIKLEGRRTSNKHKESYRPCIPSWSSLKRPIDARKVYRSSSPATVFHESYVSEDTSVSGRGDGPVSFVAALILAIAATLCKEVGATVFLLIAGAELVLFLEKAISMMFQQRAAQHGIRVPGLRQVLREYWCLFGPVAVARFVASMACATSLVALHLGLHQGHAVRHWGILENDISILPSRLHRTLSYAFTHAFYAFKLIWPEHLCYDWGFRCIPHVTSLGDPMNFAPLVLYGALAWGTVTAVSRGDTALMWGLALLVVPLLPASNIFFPIGAVMAERLLYLPSLGACALIGCMLRDAGRDILGNNERGNDYVDEDCYSRKECASHTEPVVKRTGVGENRTAKTFSSPEESVMSHPARDASTVEVLSLPIVNVNSRSKTAPVASTEHFDREDFKQENELSVPKGPTSTSWFGRKPQLLASSVLETLSYRTARGRTSSPSPAPVVMLSTRAGAHGSTDNTVGRLETSRHRTTETEVRSLSTPDVPMTTDLDKLPLAEKTTKTVSWADEKLGMAKTKIRQPRDRRVSRGLVPKDREASKRQRLMTAKTTTRATTMTTTTMNSDSRRKSRIAVVLLATGCWSLYFGVKTMERCKEWGSERRLFESALHVCPDGIKTLNNLAAYMLDVEEVGRAQGLLQRAIELHPEYPSALYNLGVVFILQEDHKGSIVALEKSLRFGGWNSRTLVCLAQEYLALAREQAMEATTKQAASATGNDEYPTTGDINKMKDVSPLLLSIPESPDGLMSRAEFYADKALAAGSPLPLARFVKGDILVLQGQFQEAVHFFRSGIEISMNILGGAVGGGVEAADAFDLGQGYDRLGLALKDAGASHAAVTETYMVGLSFVPEDTTLLINGGVAYQAAGDLVRAKLLYQRALTLNPLCPELLSNLGFLEEESGGGSKHSLESAEELYIRALHALGVFSPSRPQVETNLANIRVRLEGLDRPIPTNG